MNKKNKQKILITGATGFIGSQLAIKLIELGFNPDVLVRDKNNIKELDIIRSEVNIHEVDIMDFENLRQVITKINPQVVFHLAAFGIYTYSDLSFQNIKAIVDTNISGTINLLYSLKDLSCKLLINTGSCYEYGSSEKPFEEKDILIPINIYGSTKIASTKIAHQLAKAFNIKICTLRPFTVYGLETNPKRFITTTINNCFKDYDIKIPKMDIIRDFIYIDDVVEGYLAVFNKKNLRNDTIINLSTGIAKNLEEVALIIKNLIDSKSKIKRGEFPERFGEVLSLVGSNAIAKKLLNWQPQYSLEEGLRKMLALYSKR